MISPCFVPDRGACGTLAQPQPLCTPLPAALVAGAAGKSHHRATRSSPRLYSLSCSLLAAGFVGGTVARFTCRSVPRHRCRSVARRAAHTVYSQAPIRVPDTAEHGGRWLEKAEVRTYSDDQLVKMICTLGPASDSVEMITQLIEEGMDVARLNFSHGDHESQLRTLTALREAVAKTGRSVAALLDTKGPEIRTGLTADGKKVQYKRGTEVTVTSDYSVKGDSNTIALSYAGFATSVQPGQPIRIGDGALNLEVTDVSQAASGIVKAMVMNDARIGERKNCNIPGVKVQLPLLQEKDKNDLLQFAIPQDMDFIALSFVQDGQSVRDVRKLLTDNSKPGQGPPQLISKIENAEGLNNFDEILEASDGIMVARGDLGMEIPPERVFMAQKMAIAKCNKAGKFVITATQMLESMTGSPRPTRAEASDVANAVLDGTDCVMLSGETAAGAFPIESARMMVQICREAERTTDNVLAYQRMASVFDGQIVNPDQALCNAAVRLALDTDAKLVLALTVSGFTAREVAKFKCPVPIVVVCPESRVCRSLSLVRGVVALKPTDFEQGQQEAIDSALLDAKASGLVNAGDIAVVVSPASAERIPGFRNSLKAVPVP